VGFQIVKNVATKLLIQEDQIVVVVRDRNMDMHTGRLTAISTALGSFYLFLAFLTQDRNLSKISFMSVFKITLISEVWNSVYSSNNIMHYKCASCSDGLLPP
jgi:hypothetical protein